MSDRSLMRFKDYLLIIGAVLGLIAGIGKLYVQADSINEVKAKVKELESRIISLDMKMAVEDERWSQVSAQLEIINRKLDRMK